MLAKNSLLIFRDKINSIDKKIVQLLGERKNLVFKIAKSKIENNQAIRDIEREQKILQKLIFLGKKNYLAPKYITQLFQLIIEESVLNQENLLKNSYNNKLELATFSFLGPKGSYSYIAAFEYAKKNSKIFITNECLTFNEVISSVENNEADYAILPIENTCSGFIVDVFDLLKKTNLCIVGEINVFINHCLMAIKQTELDKIKTVYSHPQPFQQCSNFIKQFPKWEIKYTKSTADAMKKIIKYNNITNAALGSEIGSEIYGLNILSKKLANKKNNITRFILLKRNPINISRKLRIKTTLIFSIEKKSKELDNIFLILKEKKINIRKLTCQKNNKNLSEKIFYIDIETDSSVLVQNTFEKIKKITKFIKILGSYPGENISPIVP